MACRRLIVVVGLLSVACGSTGTTVSGGPAAPGSSAGGSSVAPAGGTHLTLTGAISATVTGSTPGNFCDATTRPADTIRDLTAEWRSTVNGVTYDFEVLVSFYTGPGPYASTVDKDNVDVTVGRPMSTVDSHGVTQTTTPIEFRSTVGTVIVDTDEKSGTVDFSLKQGEGIDIHAAEAVHLRGTWTCA